MELVWDEYEEKYSSNEPFEKILNNYYSVLAGYGLNFAIQAGN